MLDDKLTQKILLPILLCICGLSSFCQTDTLNKFDSKGKKNGYWKVALNDKADPTTKNNDTTFYGLELWENGKPIFKFYKHPFGKSKLTFDGAQSDKKNPSLISGTFKWYDKSGVLMVEEVYKNGSPVFFKLFDYTKSYSGSTSNVIADVDYKKRYNNIPGTHFYQEFYRKNKTIQYWFRKDKKGWRLYKLDS